MEQLPDAVRRVRVVDEDVERLALVDELPAPGGRRRRAQRRDGLLDGQRCGLRDREGRGDVVRVVAAGQPRRTLDHAARPAQAHARLPDLPAGIENLNVGGRGQAIAQDGAARAPDVRRQLPAERIVDVDDRRARGRCGRDEHRALGVAVGAHGSVSVEVFGREVREHRDVGPERRRRLELKARHLADDPAAARGRRQRRTELRVACQLGRMTGPLEHRAAQLRGRGLAVRARHAHDRRRAQSPAQLELVDDLQSTIAGRADERRIHRDARALDDRRAGTGSVEAPDPVTAERDRDAARPQPACDREQLARVRRVPARHGAGDGARPQQRVHGSATRAPQAGDHDRSGRRGCTHGDAHRRGVACVRRSRTRRAPAMRFSAIAAAIGSPASRSAQAQVPAALSSRKTASPSGVTMRSMPAN